MDPDDLLDYALGRLDPSRTEQLEQRMARDPELAEQVARLIRNLGRLLDDGDVRAAGGAAQSPRPPPTSPIHRSSACKLPGLKGRDPGRSS